MSSSHKRKNSHLFLQRKNSSSFNMEDIELDQFPNDMNHIDNARIVVDPPPSPSTQENGNAANISLRSRGIMGSWKRYRVRLMLFLGILITLLLFLVPFYIVKSTADLQKNAENRFRTRSFDIDNVLNGDFSYFEKSFHFIQPPPETVKYHEEDPGLYLSLQEDDNNDYTILAKQLYDSNFAEPLGTNKFEYESKEYVVQKVKVSYRLDRTIFATDLKAEFRHSSHGLYWIHDVETGQILPISPHPSLLLTPVSYAHFSPNFNFVYFVHDNDLYIQSLYTKNPARRLTHGGSFNILHGKPDWIYEEEVLADEKAVWWCPDDSKLIFAKFDDSEVNTYSFPKYINNGNMFPQLEEIKYPKPGSFNPKVELYMLDLNSGLIALINAMESAEGNWGEDYILYDASWVGPNAFLFKISDRSSQKLIVRIYDTKNNTIKTMYTLDFKKFDGWVEKARNVVPVPPMEEKGRPEYGYLDILPDENGFNHIFYFARFSDTKGQQITKGNWEVRNQGIVGYEYETHSVFFLSNMVGTMAQHLYTVTINSGSPGEIKTLQNPDKKEDFYEFELSPSCRYALARKLGSSVPVTIAGDLFDVLDADTAKDNNVIRLTDDNDLQKSLKRYDLPVTSYKSMVLDDGTEVNYVEIKPPFLDSKKKYPVLVESYAGPGSQSYFTKFNVFFQQAVSSGLHAIVLLVEPRGTGGKGWKFKSWAKNKIGYWEPRDITEVTRQFITLNHQFVDKERVAIWGWSYGGFAALKTIEYDAGQTFNYAMAVAPVTNWTYYDSIYTERYMGLPKENIQGYSDRASIRDFKSFEKIEKLLVIHGTADDNVHIQNSYEFVDHLNSLGIKNYDMHIFPDSDHTIHFHNAQKVVFTKLYQWLKDAFAGHFKPR
ncbi:hypothetical protein ZYGR_0S01790 [Zygosaccharomyces rouxii]|uniref:ZYRO0F06468p n=2 Tax=Zygosaccharomyces rouxii TaxID=4956 RepID=C5DXN5_ZYGRC|nr:uncharacterized protein ZYRO0F06468g [Zygosaccharomyces rouxii]KAH9199306.1 dipeptidyl peptidase IV N-terminal region-domain-containing protein [Zygosaccharomyces rouxii]GAV50045.1 hypothetical protein ZYGR_0S01790 [Zygosaccharomyces rouxii]CAR28546.1 ZYRO0F06468p [Zygosaccharomyces rouxii]